METSLNKRTRTSMTQFQQNMGMEVAERRRTNRRDIRKSSHAEVSRIPINDERMGYTMVTSWWSNGDSGPLVYVVPEQKFPATLIKVFHICLAVLSACLHPLDLSVTFWLSHLLTYLWWQSTPEWLAIRHMLSSAMHLTCLPCSLYLPAIPRCLSPFPLLLSPLVLPILYPHASTQGVE